VCVCVCTVQPCMPGSASSAIGASWGTRKPLQWPAAQWLSSMRSSCSPCQTFRWTSVKFWSPCMRLAQLRNQTNVWLDSWMWGRRKTQKTSTGPWCCAQSASLWQSGMGCWFNWQLLYAFLCTYLVFVSIHIQLKAVVLVYQAVKVSAPANQHEFLFLLTPL